MDVGLTVREAEIARLAARGLSNKVIAVELGICEGTVKVHMHNILQKLEITTRFNLLDDQFGSTESGAGAASTRSRLVRDKVAGRLF